jgi:hypothetical protein
MTKMRTVLVGLTAASLLGLPAAALATAPTSGVHQVLARHATSIRWMAFGHIHAAGAPMTLIGQVASSAHGQSGALAGVQVTLSRKLDGSTTWLYLGTQTTGTGDVPEFRFHTEARQNARYRVEFAGNTSFAPCRKTTWETVYRLFHGTISDGPGAATLTGYVSPFYTHKPITLQRRSCAACAYVTYTTRTTGTNGAYSFALPAPPKGRWWWRVSIPGTVAFMASYGGTISTQLV